MTDDPDGRRAGDRRIDVPILARVEGEGALHLVVEGGRVIDARLRIFEPPRFFEGILRGRGFTEPVDITARICGICPIAYQLGAAQALEQVCGTTLDAGIDRLRRLVLCGEWIESHLLHIALLHAPDFLGYASVVDLAADHPEVVETALRLKKLGNDLVRVLGGRPIHPVSVRVGGFHHLPARSELTGLLPELTWGLDAMADLVRWCASFEFPALEEPYEEVALHHPDEYAMQDGRIVSSGGVDLAVDRFAEQFVEFQVPHSTSLHSRNVDGRPYRVGPLARYNLNGGQLSPRVRALAAEIGLGPVCANPFKSILVRGLEVVHALEEAMTIVEAYRRPARPFVEVAPEAGVGQGAVEAPRGLLHHRYELSADGTVLGARIVPPTSQNQGVMEADLRAFAQRHLDLDDADLELRCEQVVRNYDPCISCSTHFLRLTVDRR